MGTCVIENSFKKESQFVDKRGSEWFSFRTPFEFFEREQAGLVLPFQVGYRKYSKFRKSVDGSVGVKTPAGTQDR